MKTLTFIVGKSPTGFDAYYEVGGQIVAVTTGDNLQEIKMNALEAYNLYAEEAKKSPATINDLTFRFDLPSVFEFYKELSASGLSQRVGMNKTLLSQYINGQKKVTPKQTNKILTGIKDLARELSELELV